MWQQGLDQKGIKLFCLSLHWDSQLIKKHLYDPVQVENQCQQSEFVFSRHRHTDTTVSEPFSSPLIIFSPGSGSLPRCPLTLTSSEAPPPSLFVSRSVDQFSAWLVGWSLLWLPHPSHLSLTPAPFHLVSYSPLEHMASCAVWTPL